MKKVKNMKDGQKLVYIRGRKVWQLQKKDRKTKTATITSLNSQSTRVVDWDKLMRLIDY